MEQSSKGVITHKAWKLMCEKHQFTRREIAQVLGVKTNLVTELTKRLQKQSAIKLMSKQSGNKGNLYQVITQQDDVILGIGKPQAIRAPQRIKRNTVVQQVWNSIRINRHFNKGLIQATSTAESSLITRYLGCLSKAGYIRALNSIKGSPRGTTLKYLLVRDTGRLHPTERTQGMWDQNTNTYYPFKEKGHE
ncbi:hypothetical protein [Shewanella glacialimarina]|uniref:hypothetical protein n=1 Tax=Shewanella glacialimarina TaxID=2590884 RepID=UPI001CF8DB19|nr:hypothetical protein [Shewanella glacialimarina]UCX05452.1 hypothetical protein FJ709_13735 [Shewanella glacialimarina]